MLNADEQIILDLILALKENEVAAGRFYAACAAEYVKHRDHWLFLQHQEEGHTVVLITHDKSIARTADRIISIHDGEVVWDGRASDFTE